MSDYTGPKAGEPPVHDEPPAYKPPAESPPPYSAEPPPSTGVLPKGAGGVFAADPVLVSKGAHHISLISGMIAATTEESQLVVIEPEGSGPIAKAIREKFAPAKKDSDDFLQGLHVLVKGESEKTAALARLLPRINDSANDAAGDFRRRPQG